MLLFPFFAIFPDGVEARCGFFFEVGVAPFVLEGDLLQFDLKDGEDAELDLCGVDGCTSVWGYLRIR